MTNPFVITYHQTEELNFEIAVRTLVNNLPVSSEYLSFSFFGPSDTDNYFIDYEIIKSIVQARLHYIPLISFIPQPMCGSYSYGLEITEFISENFTPRFKVLDGIRYIVVPTEWGQTLMVESVSAGCQNESYTVQSKIVFQKLNAIFVVEGFTASDIVRQWNYIGNILDFDNGNQHYQLFNNARSEFYNQVFFENGYPAATGISMSINCLFISVTAIKASPETRIIPVDNALQVPAWKYSGSVLVSGQTDPVISTPKFERGKLVVKNNAVIFYVSGTAAIRNEITMEQKDVSLQTKQTIENINYLISAENFRSQHIENELHLTLQSIRVYIKQKDDYETVKKVIEQEWPQVKAIYVQAEVCREGLLVEIEGIAEVKS